MHHLACFVGLYLTRTFTKYPSPHVAGSESLAVLIEKVHKGITYIYI
jgi:hypothetical protein